MRAQMFHREMQAKKQPMSPTEKSELLSLGFRKLEIYQFFKRLINRLHCEPQKKSMVASSR